MDRILYAIIIVGLFLSGVSALSIMLFSVQQERGTCPGICVKSPYLWLPILSALGCVVGSLAILLAIKESNKKFEKKVIDAVLTEDEALVVQELENSGGELTQQEIGWRTRMSKVKVHRIINRLMSRNLLEKMDYGKTKLVRLKR